MTYPLTQTSPFPDQPLFLDPDGVTRFRANAIVRYLLDHGGIDLNRLGVLDFTDDDRAQFAQLIGYSLSGYSELSYVSNQLYDRAADVALVIESHIDRPRGVVYSAEK